MKYFIADCHFFHESLNHQMDCRGFSSQEEMNAYMLARWNKRVTARDEVYILGDFSVGKPDETNALLSQLKGRLFLIMGNHDLFGKNKNYNADRFEWIKSYAEIRDNKRKIILCHYPIVCYNGQYLKDDAGNPRTYMLYGHVHNTHDERLVHRFQEMTRSSVVHRENGLVEPIASQMINCFCMFSDYVPLTLDEWIENDRQRRSLLSPEP